MTALFKWVFLKYTQCTLWSAWAKCKNDSSYELRSVEVARRYYAHKKGTQ